MRTRPGRAAFERENRANILKDDEENTIPVAKISSSTATSLTVRTSAILTAIWTGVMGFGFAAESLLPEQLFVVLVVALVLGAALTALTLWLTFRLSEVVVDEGGDVVVEGSSQQARSP